VAKHIQECEWVVVRAADSQGVIATALCKSAEDAEVVRAALSVLKERADWVIVEEEQWLGN
jgi:hypothetical protein